MAYIEIYNERVNDLLDKNNVDLKVREDNGEVFIKCKEEVIHMPENILTLMKRGDKNRRIGRTDMNEYSSRSHSIFRIVSEILLHENCFLPSPRFQFTIFCSISICNYKYKKTNLVVIDIWIQFVSDH